MSRLPISLVLAFLAVLALLTAPVAASAAQAACAQAGAIIADASDGAMAGMDMPMAADHTQTDAAKPSDPCCDHSSQYPADNKSCAFSCTAACAVEAVTPVPVAYATAGLVRAPLIPARHAFVRAHQPSGPERPPKSIA